MSRTYKTNELEIGDYIQIALCDGWYKITGFTGSTYVDLVDDFGSPADCLPEDITDVKLESEMPYGENF